MRDLLNPQKASKRSRPKYDETSMKRFAIFALLGPCLAGATFYLLVLPLASLLEGVKIVTPTPMGQIPIIFLSCAVPALVVGLFDWVAELIELPGRPVGSAIAGWFLAVFGLREILALPDLPGWFVAIGLIGAIPAFACSWLTARINQKQSVTP
jgi:hypothetical protein